MSNRELLEVFKIRVGFHRGRRIRAAPFVPPTEVHISLPGFARLVSLFGDPSRPHPGVECIMYSVCPGTAQELNMFPVLAIPLDSDSRRLVTLYANQGNPPSSCGFTRKSDRIEGEPVLSEAKEHRAL